MKVTRKNGYTIELSIDEYATLLEAVGCGVIWADENGYTEDRESYLSLQNELNDVRVEYLTDTETKSIRDCLCCKNCLPPSQREDGRMCKLNECKFESV